MLQNETGYAAICGSKKLTPVQIEILINKAGYTFTQFACGWAGAYLRSLHHLGKRGRSKNKNHEKSGTYRPSNQLTDKVEFSRVHTTNQRN